MTGITGRRDKRILRYGLGVLWLVDALLQMQPGMFSRAFYGRLPDKLMPSSLQTVHESTVQWGAPAVRLTQFLYEHAPVLTNSVVIAIQLVLAALFLLPFPKRWVRVGGMASVVWGLAIWVFGEGMGGLFSWGDMNIYAGFPGSALVYAFAGALLFVRSSTWSRGQVYQWTVKSVAILFLICAALQVIPANGNWSKADQMSVFGNSGFQPQPHLLSAPVMAFTNWISADHAGFTNFLEIILLIYVAGVIWFWDRWSWPFRTFVFAWLFVIWWFGMDFGFLFSGLSTDVNTPPIVALLLLSQLPRFRRSSYALQGQSMVLR